MFHYYEPNGRITHSQLTYSVESAQQIADILGLPFVDTALPGFGYVRNEEFIPFPEQPTLLHVFDYGLYEWVDPRTIDEHREAAWERVKVARDIALAAGETVDGIGKFDTDPAAQLNVTATFTALDLQPDDWTVEWTLFDNSTAVLDKETFRTVALAILGHANEVHAIGRSLRHAITIATDVSTLDAIAWPA